MWRSGRLVAWAGAWVAGPRVAWMLVVELPSCRERVDDQFSQCLQRLTRVQQGAGDIRNGCPACYFADCTGDQQRQKHYLEYCL